MYNFRLNPIEENMTTPLGTDPNRPYSAEDPQFEQLRTAVEECQRRLRRIEERLNPSSLGGGNLFILNGLLERADRTDAKMTVLTADILRLQTTLVHFNSVQPATIDEELIVARCLSILETSNRDRERLDKLEQTVGRMERQVGDLVQETRQALEEMHQKIRELNRSGV